MQFRTFDNNNACITESASHMVDLCRTVEGECYLGLSGGRTPVPVYEVFAGMDMRASQIHLYQTDERYVPHDHPDSNARMLRTSLLDNSVNAWQSVHLFDTAVSIDASLRAYAEELRRIPDQAFDLLVLGVGPDGHIVSLFPPLAPTSPSTLTMHTVTDVFAVRDRLTITEHVIRRARHILVLLQGEEKRHVFEELSAPTVSVSEFPAHILQDCPQVTVHYSLD